MTQMFFDLKKISQESFLLDENDPFGSIRNGQVHHYVYSNWDWRSKKNSIQLTKKDERVLAERKAKDATTRYLHDSLLQKTS